MTPLAVLADTQEAERIPVASIVTVDGEKWCAIPPLFRSSVDLCRARARTDILGVPHEVRCIEQIAFAPANDLRSGYCRGHMLALLDLGGDEQEAA